MRSGRTVAAALLWAGVMGAALLAPSAVVAEDVPSLVAIEPQSPWTLRELQDLSLDLVSYDPDTGVAYAVVGAAARQRLHSGGFRFSTVEPDADAGRRRLAAKPGLGLYTTHSEMLDELDYLATTYPDHCVLSVIGQTVEGRPIHALKISDDPQVDDPSEPDVLIVGNHHARELMSVEVPLHLARHLLEQRQRSRHVGDLVDNRETWIVPMLNPDGHIHQEIVQGRPGWRKNRRENEDGTMGVDLNRNYSYLWGLDNVGSSPDPVSEVYRGTAAFSEPETQALRELIEQQDFVIAISYHSFGELLLYPWGWTDRELTPDHAVFAALADSMVLENRYRPGNPYNGAIYLVNGEFDDYMYGEVTPRKPRRTFSFTVELNSLGEGGFWPDDSLIGPTCDKLLALNLYAIKVANEDLRVILPPPPPVVDLVQSEQQPWLLDMSWTHPVDPANPVDHYEIFEVDPLGAMAQQGKTARLSASGRQVVVSGLSVPPSGELVLRLSADLERLWDYAHVEVRAATETAWTTLAGDQTTDASPTGYNSGHGITGARHEDVLVFDAGAFAGRTVDVAIRLAAHADSPRQPWVEARLDVPRTFGETRRVIADDIQDTHYTVVAERVGLFAYGVTTVDVEGQRTDSDVIFVHIPEVTEVTVQDVAVQRHEDLVTLAWQMTSRGSAWFEAWTRPLAEGETPGLLESEWNSGRYQVAARQVVQSAGPQRLQWTADTARQAIILMGRDEDGARFWGPLVAATRYATQLHAAVPNPFNPQTRLRYEVARSASVQLDLFAADGRRVRTLVRGVVTAGTHDVVWDGRDDQGRRVASGVYMARFEADGVVRRQRLVLLR